MPAISSGDRALVVGVLVLTALGLVTGTVVTGTGPHAGDEDVRRFAFDIGSVARLHSVTVLLAASVALALLVLVARDPSLQRRVGTGLTNWTVVAVGQGAIGYIQYFNGVPEVLVGVHLAGATLLWVLTVQVALDALVDETTTTTADNPSTTGTLVAPVG